MSDDQDTRELFSLKAKKAMLQRTRQKLADGGKSAKLFDRMISAVDRKINEARRQTRQMTA